jgi:hypothetical protein
LKWLAVVDVERQRILAQHAREAPWNNCATLPQLVTQNVIPRTFSCSQSRRDLK